MALPIWLVAFVTSMLVLGFPPEVARAQLQLDLEDTVEQTQAALGALAEEAIALVPGTGAGGGGSNGGGGERGPAEPSPLDPAGLAAPSPAPGATEQPLESDAGGASDPASGASGAGPRTEPGRDSPAGREPAGSDPRRDVRDAPPRAPARTADAGSREGSQTTLERIVSVVPTEIKVALATLVFLVLGSLLASHQARRRLACAERRAATDPLTGLPNRTSAEEAMERLVAQGRRSGRPVSAALFDLDHFKQVNDTFGHAAGDEVLREVADAVRARVRGGDHVARFGGEEFLLLLPDTDRDGALTIAELLRDAIGALEIEGPGTVTASFGVAAMPADAISSADLLAAADRALYAAKDAGRNRVEVAGKASPRLETVA